MSQIEGYTLEKTWETPALSRAVDGMLDSHVYMINGIKYFIRIGIPLQTGPKVYSIYLCCPEPPETYHSVTVTVTFLGKKKVSIKGSGTLSESKRVIPISNPLSEATIKSLTRKDKLTLMINVTHKRSDSAIESLPDTRSLTGHVGIQNQAATCYLNSVIQLLYHIPAFRRLIYSVPTDESDKGSVIYALQRLFCLIQLSPSAPSTKELTDSFGWRSMESFQQHDAQEFMRIFIDKIEEKLKNSPLKESISHMMSGKLINRICHPLQTSKSGSYDIFYDIGVRATGKNSLNSFLTDESEKKVIEDYSLDNGEKVRATLSTLYSDLPPVLFFHLNRFDYTTRWELVTESFEYPEVLDMKEFCSEEYTGSTVYELFSVIVHIGDTVAGHYFCYCRPNSDSKWFRFNDTSVDVVPSDQAIKACNKHAYYLCYIRKTDINMIMEPVKDLEIPPRLTEYFESVRESLDFSIIPINVINSDKERVVLKKNQKVSDLMREISKKTKEIWTVDNNKLPVALLKSTDVLQEVLTPNSFVYPHESDSSQLIEPILLEIELFSPGVLTRHPAMAFSKFALIRSSIPKVCEKLGLPPKTALKCFDSNGKELNQDEEFARQSLTKGKIIFQMIDPSPVPSFQVEKPKEGLVRMRDFLPELPLNTVSTYISHVRGCIHIHIKPDNFVLEVSHLATVKILIFLLRKSLKVPEDKGIELYREEKDIFINSMLTTTLQDAFDMKGEHYQFRETSLVYKIVDMSQDKVNNMIQLKLPLYDTSLDEISTEIILINRDETVQTLLKSFHAYPTRAVLMQDRMIVKVFGPNDLVSDLLEKEIRIEMIPEEQTEFSDGEFLIRVCFAYDSFYPQKSRILLPLLLKVIPEESLDITFARVMSLFEDPIKVDHAVLEHSLKNTQLYMSDILSEHAHTDDVLYLIINRNDLFSLYGLGDKQGIRINN